jgi:hypothetical protein
MLPEFPIAQEAIASIWNAAFFDALGFSDPLIAEIDVRVQKEGHKATIGAAEIQFRRSSVVHQWKPEIGRGIPFHEFLELARCLGKDLARQQAAHTFEVLSKPGPHNAVFESADGRFFFEDFLSSVERMELDFDSAGRPKWPTCFVGSDALASLQRDLMAWERTAACRKRVEELVTKKREEFNEREARRRLVD